MPVKKYDSAVEAMQAISSIGLKSVDVPLDNEFKVTIRSLGAKDETDSFVDCMNFWGQAFIYKHKIETLTRSITHVNDVSVESMDLDVKRSLIGAWAQNLVDDLYTKYAELIGSVDEFLEKIRLTAQTNVVGMRENEQKIQKDEKEENEGSKDESAKE